MTDPHLQAILGVNESCEDPDYHLVGWYAERIGLSIRRTQAVLQEKYEAGILDRKSRKVGRYRNWAYKVRTE